MIWRVRHRAETVSTNLDAREGAAWDVFTADYQTGGRGRLDHKWSADRGRNVIMSAVLPVDGIEPAEAATLPLVIGLAVVKAVGGALKWPNDVYVGGEKVAGILCERQGELVIAGIGINIDQSGYRSIGGDRDRVRDAVLAEIAALYPRWREGGFAAVYGEIAEIDFLKGRELSVWQTDDDTEPLVGPCGGILPDGSLEVGGRAVYAGEAHIERFAGR